MKHVFDVTVASEVGVNAAIVFENIAFWIEHNKKAGKNEKEGRFWMYSSINDLAENFEYLTIKQTRTAIDKLLEAGYIIQGCFNRHGYDRTRWYALGEKGESIFHSGQIDLPSEAKGTPTGAKVIDLGGTTIPDIKADIKPNIKPDLLARAEALKAKLIV